MTPLQRGRRIVAAKKAQRKFKQLAHTTSARNLHNHRNRQACRNIKRQKHENKHSPKLNREQVVELGVRLGVWRAGARG